VLVVLDASAAVYVATSRRGFGALSGHQLVGPHLLWSEAISALHQGAWRGAITRPLAVRALSALLGAPIELRTHDQLADRAWQIADELGWAKTYDAEYVALAQLLDAPLLTRDARLRRGAQRVARTVGPADL
jgi:predicted nucleic acid-binding protein